MSNKQAWIGFFVLGLIWGSSFLFIRIGVEQLGPFEVVFIRTGIAAIGLTLVAYARGKRLPTHWDGIRDLIILGVVNTVVPFAFITWGEKSIDSGLAAVLQAAAALFTLVVAHFAFADERITMKKIGGLVVGFIGVIILVSQSWKDGQVATGSLTGQLAIVVASFFYAIGGTYSRRVLKKGIEPIIAASGAMITTAIVSGVLMVIAPALGGATIVMPADMQSNVLFAMIALGLLNTFVAYIIFYSIIPILGAARTSMVTYIVPAVGLALGAIFLKEVVDFRLLLGAALILTGIGIVNLRLVDIARGLFKKSETALPQPVD
ncbi:MAG: DMT family transporter [Chloroflexota bacterium]